MTLTERLALEYLDAVSKQQYDKVAELLAPDLHFRGPATTRTSFSGPTPSSRPPS